MASIAVLGCLVLGHSLLLKQAALWLIVEESHPEARCLAILGGDRCFAYGARQYAGGTLDRILLIQESPNRLVRMGIVQSRADVGQQELERLGVPAAQISTVSVSSREEWEWVRRVQTWLAAHPDASVNLVCDQFQSGYWRHVLDRVLGETERARVAVQPLPDRRYDETNWWKSRTGFKDYWWAAMDWVYVRTRGEDRPVQGEWDPDAYESALRPCAGLP